MKGGLLKSAASVACAAVIPGSILMAAAAAAPPPRSGAAAPTPPAIVHFLPKARPGSSFALNVRFEIETRDVTFEVPPAYRDSFAFWTKKMKGGKRSELFQFVTLTDDAAAGDAVGFRKQLARYQVEMQQGGESLNPYNDTVKHMQGLAWEGHFDRFGNVKDSRLVAGKQDPDMADLGVAWVEAFFPRVEGPRDLKVGDRLTAVESLPLPSRLNIEGLELIRVQVTRELTLRAILGSQVRFDIKTTYATDPATKPTVEGAVCVIGGGGKGDASFDLKRGVFIASHQTSSLTIDIEAPLRPLPEHPETQNAGPGKSHLQLEVGYTGEQTVHAILGEDQN